MGQIAIQSETKGMNNDQKQIAVITLYISDIKRCMHELINTGAFPYFNKFKMQTLIFC